MNTVTTKDGVEIFYKDWGRRARNRSFSITVGRSHPMTGTLSCFTSCIMVIASSRMTGAAMAGPAR